MNYPVKRYGDFLLVNPVNPTGGNRYIKALTRRQRRRLGYPRYRGVRGTGLYDWTVKPLLNTVRSLARGTASLITSGYNGLVKGTVILSGIDALLQAALRGVEYVSTPQYIYIISSLLVLLSWISKLSLKAIKDNFKARVNRTEIAVLRSQLEALRANRESASDQPTVSQLQELHQIVGRINRLIGVIAPTAQAAAAVVASVASDSRPPPPPVVVAQAADPEPFVVGAPGDYLPIDDPSVLVPVPPGYEPFSPDSELTEDDGEDEEEEEEEEEEEIEEIPAPEIIPTKSGRNKRKRYGKGYHPFGYGYESGYPSSRAYMYSSIGQLIQLMEQVYCLIYLKRLNKQQHHY